MVKEEEIRTSELEIFRNFIKRKGLRYTPEREIILKEIFNIHDHFDVDELYLRLRNKGYKISKASIYRTLPLLIECGLVQEVYHEDGHMHYEHIYGHEPHAHFRCLSCRRVEEFRDERLEKVAQEYASKYGIEVKMSRFEILGYCANCASKEDRE